MVKLVPSVTADLWPQVGEGVSEQSVASELPICSSARMAVEDSLSEGEESVLGAPRSWLWIRLSRAGLGYLYKQCGKLWGLDRREGPRSSGADAGPEPLPAEKVVWLNGITGEGHEEEASGVVCLYVCEAFTSNTLAVNCWFPCWDWGKIVRKNINYPGNKKHLFAIWQTRQSVGFICKHFKEIHSWIRWQPHSTEKAWKHEENESSQYKISFHTALQCKFG